MPTTNQCGSYALKAETSSFAKDQLVFNKGTRTLSLSGTGSRKKGKDDRKRQTSPSWPSVPHAPDRASESAR